MAGVFFFVAWAVAAIATAALGCWFDWGSTLRAVAFAFAWAAVATVLAIGLGKVMGGRREE